MHKFEVTLALEAIKDSRDRWREGRKEFDAGVERVMARLLHEAMRHFMSVGQVSRLSGLTPARVRMLMRKHGLDQFSGKRLLSEKAAKALEGNAELLGIQPHEIDLTSPLAYLPAGKDVERLVRDQTVSQVTELPEDPMIHGINFFDHEIGCQIINLGYTSPVHISFDMDKITCPGCRFNLVKA